MAGEFATHVNDGDAYSVEEVGAWLGDTGYRYTGKAPRPISLITAEAA